MKPDWAVRLQRTFERRYQAGVLAERERIIKLLEDDTMRRDVWQRGEQRIYWMAIDRAIALIKGEK